MKLSGAEAVAKALEKCGVQRFFYMMGGMPLYGTIENEGVKTVLCRNEKAAASMADGFARVTKRPTVCYAQHGAASHILASMMYEPMFSHSPVVALTGSIPTMQKHQWRYQECYEMRYFDETCKFNVDVTDVSRLAEYIRTAIQVAVCGCPGPTHVNMHLDMAEVVVEMPEPYGDKTFLMVPPFRPRAEPERVAAAAKLLSSAERPVMICGSGVHLSGAYDEVRELAELLAIPVVTNQKGKGCFPEDHPLSVGIMGIYGSTFANDLVRESDLVFFAATRADSHMTEDVTAPQPGASKIIHLDIDPVAIGRNYRADVALVGDAKPILQDLLATLKTMIAKPKEQRLQEIFKARKQYESIIRPYMDSDAIPIKPQRVIKEIMNVLGPRDVIVSDTGQALCWTARLMKLKGTGMTFIPVGGTLGSSFPLAIGVAFGAEKDQRVLNFIGDGGMGYNLTDLETAKRYASELVPLVFLVNNNSSLGMGRPTMGEDWSKEKAPWVSSCDFTPVNYAKIAEAFGCYGARVERPGELADALQNAFDHGKPAVVEVVTDMRTYAPIGLARKVAREAHQEMFGVPAVY